LKSKLFGDNYEWIMDKKHEDIVIPHLFYCFVLLRENKQLPRFFIVPSREVAEYVKWEHKHWLECRKRKIKVKMKEKQSEFRTRARVSRLMKS